MMMQQKFQRRGPCSIQSGSTQSGFTLIEILAVIVIIGILAAFIVPKLMSGGEAVRSKATRAFLAQLSSDVDSFEREKGSYPLSSFPKDMDPKPSPTNMGIEALVVALMPADGSYSSGATYDERLGNSDGDDTKRSLTRFTKSEAFEIMDAWDNPIAYLHRRDYERGCTYRTYSEDQADFVDEKVTAAINPTTGDPFRPDSFQLLSAGPDGVFGTGDDIGNFK